MSNEENEKQNISLAIVATRLENIIDLLKQNEKDHIVFKETLRWQEEKRCKKNDFILETINKSNGKLEEKLSKIDVDYDKRCEKLEEIVKGDNVKSILSLYDNAKNLGIKLIVLLGLLGLIYMTYLINLKK